MPASVRDTLNMRIKPEDRSLLDWAAKSQGKTRTDFILEAARKAAEDALLDRTIVRVDPAAYAEFLDRLDKAPETSERLKRTMRTKAPWE
jgi:uncharacterized protein (DUF1778 family)